MPLREQEFTFNVMIVKSLGTDDFKKLKVVYMPVCKNKGVEVPRKKKKKSKIDECCISNDERLQESVSRSKRMIYEYAFCNHFDYFFTGTIDSSKFNRYDLESYHRDLTIWIRNLNRNHKCNIEYIFVPELHKDGAVHIHGLINGIPDKMIHKFVIGDTFGKTIANKVKAGEDIYDWIPYHKKYGFCCLEKVISLERISKYITKYITKDLILAVDKGKQSFWHSKGLKKAEIILKGRVGEIPFKFDFVNDYVSLKTFPDTEIIRNSLESLLLKEKKKK